MLRAWNVWLTRLIYLVQDGTRFHVVSRMGVDAKSLDALAPGLKPQLFSDPMKVAIRDSTPTEQMAIDALIQAGKKKPNYRSCISLTMA